MNPTSIHEGVDSIPGLAQWVRILRCCELWCRSQMQHGFQVTMAVAKASSGSSASISSLGTSICHGCGLRKKKERKKYVLMKNKRISCILLKVMLFYFTSVHFSFFLHIGPLWTLNELLSFPKIILWHYFSGKFRACTCNWHIPIYDLFN